MAVTINFNTLTASTNNLGKIGEHNSTELAITYTNSDERCSQYRIAFATGKEVILSETYTEMPINIYLWQQLTKCPRISIQVLCYDDDGEYISKSAKMSGFYFEPSIGNTTVEADGSNPDMAGEITDLDTRLTSAEADIDTLDAGKQSKITASNKLPYSLISGTPTIPTIPTNVSAFTNDAGYLTSHQDISGKQDKIDSSHKLSASLVDGLSTVATSGSYADLSNKPTIPDVSGKADKSYVDTQLTYKQDKLTAGENITITSEGVISASGGGSSAPIEMAEYDTQLTADVGSLYDDYVSGKKLTYLGNEVINFKYDEDLEVYNWAYHHTVYNDSGEVESLTLVTRISYGGDTCESSTESMDLFDTYLDSSLITSSITDSTTTTLLPNVSAVKGYVDSQISTVLNTSFGGDS